MRSLIVWASLTLGLVVAANTASVSGRWVGSVELPSPGGEVINIPAFATLKQVGQSITGTAGTSATEQSPIKKGRVQGDVVTCEITLLGATHTTYSFELRMLSSRRMEGKVVFGAADGRKSTGKAIMTRLE